MQRSPPRSLSHQRHLQASLSATATAATTTTTLMRSLCFPHFTLASRPQVSRHPTPPDDFPLGLHTPTARSAIPSHLVRLAVRSGLLLFNGTIVVVGLLRQASRQIGDIIVVGLSTPSDRGYSCCGSDYSVRSGLLLLWVCLLRQIGDITVVGLSTPSDRGYHCCGSDYSVRSGLLLLWVFFALTQLLHFLGVLCLRSCLFVPPNLVPL